MILIYCKERGKIRPFGTHLKLRVRRAKKANDTYLLYSGLKRKFKISILKSYTCTVLTEVIYARMKKNKKNIYQPLNLLIGTI